MFGQWRPCEVCGRNYIPASEDQWACSDSCKLRCVVYDEDNGYYFDDQHDVFIEYENKSRYKPVRSRRSKKYHAWRVAVFERDGECQACGSNYLLTAHHIIPYSECVELRYDVSNGITLCEQCHREFHSTYGRKNIGKEHIERFIESKRCES
jgi:hypothetical protein